MNKYAISVRNLTKVYKDGSEKIYALDNVSFNVREGEDVFILGPSGSGKTTLLELMAGLNTPTKGEVFIGGRNVHKGSDEEISSFRNKTLGFVFQMMHLLDYFNAVENVMIPLIAAGADRGESVAKAEKLLEEVGLGDKKNKYPNQLSGGEMQRIAIARALANDPKIIMADEPTGSLDKKNADNVIDILCDISKKRNVNLIIITHDSSIAKKFNRVIKLDHGKVSK